MSGSRPAEEGQPVEIEVIPDTGSVEVQTTQAVETPIADGTPEGSSPTEGEKPKTLLEVTRAALRDGNSPVPDNAKPDAKPAEGATPKPGEAKPAEVADKDLPFNTHPRFKQVLAERSGFQRQVESLKPDADMHRATLEFMTRNHLAPDDVRNGFAIMAALRNNPAEAWRLMEPIVKDVRTFLGHELPADLSQKVTDGLVDEDTARETARLRNARVFETNRATQTQAMDSQRAAYDRASQSASAVDSWVAEQAGKDPDFAHVNPLLEGAVRSKQAEWVQAGKGFDNPQAALALVAEAYQAVKTHLSGLRPARQPSRALPASGNSSTAAAPPKTLREAVAQALRAGS